MSQSDAAAETSDSTQIHIEVDEYKENQNIINTSPCPVNTAILGKTAKVCLVPLSLSSYKLDQFKYLKALLDKNSNRDVVCKKCKKTATKKTDRRILAPRTEATSSKEESTLQKFLDVHTESKKLHSDSMTVSVDVESSQHGNSDEDNTSDLDEFSELSPYERKRLKNISENANFFASLQLSESAARLREMIKKREPPEFKRKKPKKTENEAGCRRSMRLLKVDPSGVPLPTTLTRRTVVTGENPLLPSGPLEMTPENRDDDDELFEEFLQTWSKMNKKSSKNTEELPDIQSYKANLNDMVICEKTVCKVVKGPVFSLAFHPSETRTLVAAGTHFGQIGLWDLTQQPKEDGVYVFQPHTQPVTCLYFSPANSSHILSLSSDGTLRCGDFSRAVFEEVCRDEGSSFSSFDFLAENAYSLIVGHWDGSMSLVDRRTPETSFEKLNSSLSKIRTVHVHPACRQYFMTAGLRDVHIYDARWLKWRSKPLISLTEHTKSVAGAYFSPLTGNRVVTTCTDCKLRIFDSSCISSDVPLLTSFRHNIVTGRWLSNIQAVWDPKKEDCIIVGSNVKPRRVEIFHETGKLVHSFFHEECLTSLCSINAMHPTRYILAGGNYSGKVHVFMK